MTEHLTTNTFGSGYEDESGCVYGFADGVGFGYGFGNGSMSGNGYGFGPENGLDVDKDD